MIDSALSWIGELAQFVGSLFPRLLVVQASHRAVKYVRGSNPVVLAPGVHLYWPLVTPIEICAVVRQVLDIPPKLLTTADGQTVAAGGVVEFEIDDPMRFLAECENGYRSILSVGGATIRAVILDNTLEELMRHEDVLRRELVDAMEEALEPYGVLILTARLGDMAPVKAVHLTGDVTGSPSAVLDFDAH